MLFYLIPFCLVRFSRYQLTSLYAGAPTGELAGSIDALSNCHFNFSGERFDQIMSTLGIRADVSQQTLFSLVVQKCQFAVFNFYQESPMSYHIFIIGVNTTQCRTFIDESNRNEITFIELKRKLDVLILDGLSLTRQTVDEANGITVHSPVGVNTTGTVGNASDSGLTGSKAFCFRAFSKRGHNEAENSLTLAGTSRKESEQIVNNVLNENYGVRYYLCLVKRRPENDVILGNPMFSPSTYDGPCGLTELSPSDFVAEFMLDISQEECTKLNGPLSLPQAYVCLSYEEKLTKHRLLCPLSHHVANFTLLEPKALVSTACADLLPDGAEILSADIVEDGLKCVSAVLPIGTFEEHQSFSISLAYVSVAMCPIGIIFDGILVSTLHRGGKSFFSESALFLFITYATVSICRLVMELTCSIFLIVHASDIYFYTNVFPDWVCTLTELGYTFTYDWCVFTIFFITVNRFIVVCFPLKKQTPTAILKSVIIGSLLFLVCCSAYLAVHRHIREDTSCPTNNLSNVEFITAYRIYFTTHTSAYCLLFFGILMMNSKIIHRIWSQVRKRKSLTTSQAAFQTPNKEIASTVSLVGVSVLFIILCGPQCVCMMLQSFLTYDIVNESLDIISTFEAVSRISFLIHTSTCLPVILFCGSRFRQMFKEKVEGFFSGFVLSKSTKSTTNTTN